MCHFTHIPVENCADRKNVNNHHYTIVNFIYMWVDLCLSFSVSVSLYISLSLSLHLMCVYVCASTHVWCAYWWQQESVELLVFSFYSFVHYCEHQAKEPSFCLCLPSCTALELQMCTAVSFSWVWTHIFMLAGDDPWPSSQNQMTRSPFLNMGLLIWCPNPFSRYCIMFYEAVIW